MYITPTLQITFNVSNAMCNTTRVATSRKFAVVRVINVLGGPFDLVSRVSKVGYGGL